MRPLPAFREHQVLLSDGLRLLLVFLSAFAIALGSYGIGVGAGRTGEIAGLTVGGLVAAVVFLLMRLDVEVEGDRLRIVLGPFARRDVPLGSVTAVTARRLRRLEKRAGYEIRRKSRAFLMGSRTVVELSLADDTRVIVGTRRPEELLQAIRIRLAPEASRRPSGS